MHCDARREDGFTLIEVLIAVTLMSVGVAATMRVFGAAGRTTVRAQQQQVAVQQAQAELDRLAALRYGELALTSAPMSSSDPLDPGDKVSGRTSRCAPTSPNPWCSSLAPAPRRASNPARTTFAVGTGGGTTAAASTATSPGETRTARCCLCEGAAEHQARDRRRHTRPARPELLPGRPCGSRRSSWTPPPRRPARRRRPVAAPAAATRSRPTRSTSTTLPAGRARASPRPAATPRATRPRRGRPRRTPRPASTRTRTTSRT